MPAAGKGERARSTPPSKPKQFRSLGGKPMFMWAVEVLIEAGCSPVIVVVPEELLEEAAATTARDPDVVVVRGGAERQDSVGLGLEHVGSDLVLIHDAARPFVTVDLVRSVFEAAVEADAVIAAMPVDETLKRVEIGSDVSHLVRETIDRSTVWRSQTPAAFRTENLRDAHRRAAAEGFVGTDESQLVERYGGTVKVVMGSRANLKVTFPEDFAVAEAMLKANP